MGTSCVQMVHRTTAKENMSACMYATALSEPPHPKCAKHDRCYKDRYTVRTIKPARIRRTSLETAKGIRKGYHAWPQPTSIADMQHTQARHDKGSMSYGER